MASSAVKSLARAVVFPGQGAQQAGIASTLFTWPTARAIADAASETLGLNIPQILTTSDNVCEMLKWACLRLGECITQA